MISSGRRPSAGLNGLLSRCLVFVGGFGETKCGDDLVVGLGIGVRERQQPVADTGQRRS
jgi:hypothetical protein